MATFVLIHGGGETGWAWHLVEAELRRLGHATVAPDLPTDDPDAGLWDCADAVTAALGTRAATGEGIAVVGASLGGFTAPLVCERLGDAARLLVLVSAMTPAPGESVGDWWVATGQGDAHAHVLRTLGIDADDAAAVYFHDVPPELAAGTTERERPVRARAMAEPWPLEHWPDVPIRAIIGTHDRLFPPAFQRRVIGERLGLAPDEIEAGHCTNLAAPRELAAYLDAAARDVGA